jgi:hypothetical protein
VFRTGERLRGAIVAEQPGAVIFDSQAMGRIDVPRERILRLERDPAPAPAESTVLLTTTNTVPAADRETNAPATSRDFLRFYTERGVRYEFVHAIPVIDPFQSLTNLSSENIEVRGRIGFRGSVDAAGYHSTRGQQHVDPDAEVRSLRVYTTGEFGIIRTNEYKLDLGLSGGSFYLHDVSLRYPQLPYVGNFTKISRSVTLQSRRPWIISLLRDGRLHGGRFPRTGLQSRQSHRTSTRPPFSTNV